MTSTSLRCLCLASWWVAHVLLTIAVFAYALPEIDRGSSGAVVYPSITEVYALFRLKLAPWLPSSLAIVTLLAVAVLTAFFGALAWIVSALLDRFALRALSIEAKGAITWAGRKFFASGLACLSALLVVASVAAAEVTLWSNLFVLFAAACAFASVLLPTFTLNSRFLLGGDSGRIRHLRWPGWRHAALWTGVCLLLVMLDGLPMAVSVLLVDAPVGSSVLATGLFVMLYLFGLFANGVMLGIVVDRIGISHWGNEIRRRANARFIARWLVLDAWLILIAACLAAPLLAATLASIYVAPQLHHTIAESGDNTGAGLLAVLRACDTLYTALPATLLALVPLLTMIAARYLLRCDALEDAAAVTAASGTMARL